MGQAAAARMEIVDGRRLIQFGLLSLGLHLIVIVLLVWGPGLGWSPDGDLGPVYTVDLVGDPGPPPPPPEAGPKATAPPAQAQARPKPKPVEKVKAPEPAELIPIGKDKDKEKPKEEVITKMGTPKLSSKIRPVDDTKELDKALEKIESRVAQNKAEQEQADREKVESDHLAKALDRARQRVKNQVYGTGAGGGGSGGKSTNPLAIYYSQVWQKIQQNWTLPAEWSKKDIEAIVVLWVRKDGRITRWKFERKSGNARFDQSVAWAVERSSPLPQLPPAAAGSTLEIGVRFRPENG